MSNMYGNQVATGCHGDGSAGNLLPEGRFFRQPCHGDVATGATGTVLLATWLREGRVRNDSPFLIQGSG